MNLSNLSEIASKNIKDFFISPLYNMSNTKENKELFLLTNIYNRQMEPEEYKENYNDFKIDTIVINNCTIYYRLEKM